VRGDVHIFLLRTVLELPGFDDHGPGSCLDVRRDAHRITSFLEWGMLPSTGGSQVQQLWSRPQEGL
jgi:hypothetical protein